VKQAALAALLLLGACAGTPPGAGSAGGAGGDVAAQLRVAAAAERSGQDDVALSVYAAAAAANPGNPDIAERHAALLLRLGAPAEARAALAEARRRNPDHAGLARLEGRILLETGDAAQALAVFDRLLQAAPRDGAALIGRGVALDLLGRHTEARQAYLAARSLEPANPLWAGNLALSLMLAGCPETAEAVLAGASRTAETAQWLSEMEVLARSLAAGQGGLAAALPRGSTPCPAIS
jgi:Flp pilus assembly protein TadD